MHWPAVSTSIFHGRPAGLRRQAGGSGRVVLRVQAYGLAVAVGQAALIAAGAIDDWPLKDILWYAF